MTADPRHEAVRAVLARQTFDPVSVSTLTDRVLAAVDAAPTDRVHELVEATTYADPTRVYVCTTCHTVQRLPPDQDPA